MKNLSGTSSTVTDTVKNFDALPGSAFVRLPTVCTLLGISRPTAWRWVKSGRLPTPRRLGPR
ncbi:MAG: AlpA family phage regulatory protein, partial [Burkholderiales bacterium]|nr:AlpA family phage regulatory protein [Burkholderiales bacterium]